MMKRIKSLYQIISLSIFALIIPVLAGCGALHEDLQPCEAGVRLKVYYDYNMKFADAFPAEVKEVSVYVFEPDSGTPIDEKHVQVGNVREHEFEVVFDNLTPGHYDFLVWCFGDAEDNFTINPPTKPGDETYYHSCLMSEDAEHPGHQSRNIGRLYHGRITNIDCTDTSRIQTLEVPLKKNTNTVRLVLQHLSGEYLNPDHFDISLKSDNGHMNRDNNLIKGHSRIYHPWAVESGVAGMERLDEGTRAITSVSALVAEHTIGRIVPETGVNLSVRNTRTGEEIINIPFIDYALLVKGNYNRPMDDQEYLDRQDEYNMVFFLDDKLHWMNQYVYINSWRILLQNNDLK